MTNSSITEGNSFYSWSDFTEISFVHRNLCEVLRRGKVFNSLDCETKYDFGIEPIRVHEES